MIVIPRYLVVPSFKEAYKEGYRAWESGLDSEYCFYEGKTSVGKLMVKYWHEGHEQAGKDNRA